MSACASFPTSGGRPKAAKTLPLPWAELAPRRAAQSAPLADEAPQDEEGGWFVANTVSDFDPGLGGRAWLVGNLVGIPLTLWLTVRQARGAEPKTQAAFKADPALGRRIGLSWMALVCFFAGLTSVVAPLDGRQVNAFISLFWACAYMAAGAWLGWRLFIIGAVTAAAILFGYHWIDEHYALWMGVVGGGSLVAGGLWLRKV